MRVPEAVAATLAGLGADTVFGVVGSGNFHVTNALISQGARYVAARHEGGAACMADGWARTARRTGLLTVHQGPGLTNAVTGITEAAKSRTPLLVLAADVAGAAVTSNFRIDVAALTAAVGATPERLHSPASAAADAARAYHAATLQRRTVVLAMPLDVQAGECDRQPPAAGPVLGPVAPAADAADALAAALARARRPVFVAGRGARIAQAGPDLERLAAACGALLATSAAAKGLFRGSPWDLDVSGGFATPLAAGLIGAADLIVGWGCALNMWTMRHGSLIGPEATVVQVDDDPAAIGAHRPVHLGVLGDVAETARAALAALGDRFGSGAGYRTEEVRSRIAREGRWRDVPYADESGGGRIDPRTLSIALDDLLPAERTVCVDSGNFMGYPSMFLSVPDARRVLLHPGVPVRRAGPGLRDRGRHRPAGPADGGRAGRRRRADGRQRTGDGGPARAGPADRGVRRRGVRGRGAPLRPGRPPAGRGPLPGRPISRRSAAGSAAPA